MRNKLAEYNGHEFLLDDSHDQSSLDQSKNLRKSMFKVGDSIYRSIYKKPMEANLWICCLRIRRPPLVGSNLDRS